MLLVSDRHDVGFGEQSLRTLLSVPAACLTPVVAPAYCEALFWPVSVSVQLA